MMNIQTFLASLCASCIALAASAQDVRITTFKQDSTYVLNGQQITVSRTQNQNETLPADFARVARACPPACIQPMRAADGVETLGELEVLSFLETEVTNGRGLVLDVRAPEDFERLAIPGSINVPFATLGQDNRFRDDILRALGAVDAANDTLDFTDALSLTIFSGGPWSPDATTAIDNLLSAGYPADKLFYFRGGMQAWVHVGLTVQ